MLLTLAVLLTVHVYLQAAAALELLQAHSCPCYTTQHRTHASQYQIIRMSTAALNIMSWCQSPAGCRLTMRADGSLLLTWQLQERQYPPVALSDRSSAALCWQMTSLLGQWRPAAAPHSESPGCLLLHTGEQPGSSAARCLQFTSSPPAHRVNPVNSVR
jgi:hypothetical protein